MLNARIRQQPLQIPLHQNEWSRDEHRQQTQREQEVAGKRGAQCRVGNEMNAQHAIQSAVQHADRHQHTRRRWCLAIGIRFPRVHRGEPCLRAVSDQGEYDAEPQRERVKGWRDLHETSPVQGGQTLAEMLFASGEQQDNPEQREPETQTS